MQLANSFDHGLDHYAIKLCMPTHLCSQCPSDTVSVDTLKLATVWMVHLLPCSSGKGSATPDYIHATQYTRAQYTRDIMCMIVDLTTLYQLVALQERGLCTQCIPSIKMGRGNDGCGLVSVSQKKFTSWDSSSVRCPQHRGRPLLRC